MDNLEKKRLANEKRLKAIQLWQKNRNQNVIKIPRENLGSTTFSPPNKIVKLSDSDDVSSSTKNQLKLFDSDDEAEENLSDCFKIRPQFEGKNGLRMLEMSSELDNRFKFDERFREGEDEISKEDPEDSEKNKNIRILESILGHEVGKKHPIEVKAKRKKEIERFDPEAESGASCLKNVEDVPKKARKKNRKTEHNDNNVELPCSSERYIEVPSNLKDIMNSAGTFSFSDKFNVYNDVEETEVKELDRQHSDPIFSNKQESQLFYSHEHKNKSEPTYDINFKDPFFISSSDERLKEGVQFFMRPKELEEIRQVWQNKRNELLEIFRRRKISSQRSTVKRPNKSQTQRKRF